MKIKFFFELLKEKFIRCERYISGGALLAGFAVDNFTLTRVDLWLDNLILFSYLAIAFIGIFFVNLYESGTARGAFFGYLRSLSPFAVQFAFGGLFSGLIIFYSRSATLAANWPFIFLLLALFIGNEFFRSRYSRLTFQLGVFFIVLFSFMIFYVPVVVGSIGALVFIISGAVSVLIISALIYIFSLIMPARARGNKKSLMLSIGGIFILINILYFTNIIPPIPLSLKEVKTYHYVERTESGNYLARRELSRWYEFLYPRKTVHIAEGEPVFVFSSVFAPTKLNAQIFHKWQFYDEEKNKWTVINRFGFSITGGRDGGYRGYTMKTNVPEGIWRVDVVTGRDQLIGRVKFKVEKVGNQPMLQTDIR